MVRIAVAGGSGRMGRRLCALALEYGELKLTGAFERPGHVDLGKDVGELCGVGALGIKLVDNVEAAIKNADVLIDFTHHEATAKNVVAAGAAGKAMVIGTTGLTPDNHAQIKAQTGKIACVVASNMSLGVNLLCKVLKDVARALGDDYDVEVVEAHHKMKKDAPSGTALMMARAVAEALDRTLEKDAVYARHGMIGERTKKEIGIQTIRGGDIVGEHTVMFIGMGERIEVTHRVSSRDTFARGALKAAIWLGGKKAGLYDMQDVLGLK